MEKTTNKKPVPKSNGTVSEEEIQQLNSAAIDKLQRFLDKEGLAIEGYFQCLNGEVLTAFQESPFVKMKLISAGVRVVKVKK